MGTMTWPATYAMPGDARAASTSAAWPLTVLEGQGVNCKALRAWRWPGRSWNRGRHLAEQRLCGVRMALSESGGRALFYSFASLVNRIGGNARPFHAVNKDRWPGTRDSGPGHWRYSQLGLAYMFARFSSTTVLIRSPRRATSNGFLKASLKPKFDSVSGAASSSLASATIRVCS